MRLDRAHVLRLLAYHHWAGGRLFDAVASLAADELDAPWGGSFGTGRKLLAHVVGGDRLWCDRWSGRPSQGTPRVPQYPDDYGGRDFRDEWERIRADEQRVADGLTQARLDGDLTYVNTQGETQTFTFADVFVHVVNHGTYHRGQIAHLLRDRGRVAPSTDFIAWVRAERGR